MRGSVEFSKCALFTSQHATDCLNHCKTFFKWHESENILEVGCSDGRVTKEVLHPFVEEHLGNLTSVDISEEAIAIAKENNCKDNLSYSVLDITKEENGSKFENLYDHIFSFYCLHCIYPDQWPDNFYRMTKSGGQIFATVYLTPNMLTKAISDQLAEENAPWAKYFHHYERFHKDYGSKPEKTFLSLLTNAGFVVETWDILEFKLVFNEEQLAELLKSADTFTVLLPEELREEYSKDFLNKVKIYWDIDENGYYTNTIQTLVFVAYKP